MDDMRRWDTKDVLDGVDELLSSGVAPDEEPYSLEEILRSMDEVSFYGNGKVAAPRPKAAPVPTPPQPEEEEDAAEAVEEPVDDAEAAEEEKPQRRGFFSLFKLFEQKDEPEDDEESEEEEPEEPEAAPENASVAEETPVEEEAVSETEEVQPEQPKKSGIRSFFGLFASKKDEKDDEEPAEEVEETESAPEALETVEEAPAEEETAPEEDEPRGIRSVLTLFESKDDEEEAEEDETTEDAPAEEAEETEEAEAVEETDNAAAEETAEAPTVEKAAIDPAEEYSLEAIMREFDAADGEISQSYTLEDIVREYGDPQPEEEQEEEPLPEVPSPELDLEEMAAFIGQNVSNAMGPEDEPLPAQSEEDPAVEGIMERFRSRGSRLKSLFQQDSEKAAEVVPEEVAQPVEEPVPETEADADTSPDTIRVPVDNISKMSVPKMKLFRDSFGKIQDKMDNFADNMYSDAVTEEDDLEDSDLPETDEEQIPVKDDRPSLRETVGGIRRKLGLTPPKAPDIAANVLARRYKLGLGFMGRRLFYMTVLLAAALYLTVAAETALPLPVLEQYPRAVSAILTWLLGMSCAAGLDVLWMGMTAPFRGRAGLHTLTSAAVLATLVDGVYYTVIGREGPLPFSAVAILALFCNLLGALWRKRALYHSCQAVARCNEAQRVTLDPDAWSGKAAFFKQKGSAEGFGSQIQEMDGATRIYRLWVPVIGLLAVVAAVASTILHGQPALFTWALSGILVAAAPLSGLLAFAHPYSKLSRRLDHSGAVLAGWEGAASMSGKAAIVLKDVDLFPVGSTIQRRVAQAEGVPLEKLTACAASILYAAGSGLYHLFDSELRRQGGSYRRVDNLQVYETGGYSADIRDEEVLLGSYGFLNLMGVEVPEGQRARGAVFCAINKKLSGIFFLDYSMLHNDKQAVRDLVRCGIDPILATRDFNIAPPMLLNLFELPVERMEYPRLNRRRDLSEEEQEHNPVLGAIVTRDNLSAYADAVIGGRRLYRIVRINAILALLASLVGLALGFFLTWTVSFSSLTPLSMLLFLLIWAVPNVAISGAADKF